MNILLIGINFGNYEWKIKEKMALKGHKVDYIWDAPKNYTVVRRVLGEDAATKISINYQNKMLSMLDMNYELVIVIVGRLLTVDFLKALKQKNPQARFVLYLWDDVRRVENFDKVRKQYDYIYSFDPVDCEQYGFRHLPLFYTETDVCNDKKKEIDIYSAMFGHSDRIHIATNIVCQANNRGLHSHIYICLGRFRYIIYILKKIFKRDDDGLKYIGRPIAEEMNYEYVKKSKAVLDVQFSTQVGLTMRTIECLGLGVKLITTNKSIKRYDFYNENNILIIDRDDSKLDMKFLEVPYVSVETEILKKYTLDSWIDVLINCAEANNYLVR